MRALLSRLPLVTVFTPALLSAALFFAAPAAQAGDDVPPTVDQVDLERYMGDWYEIASIPQWFQRGCVASKATYALRDDGKVDVLNSCRIDSFDGRLKTASAVARAVDETNAKLKVTFFWPFAGDYWIFLLGDDYEYAVVGSPDRESLWILSRTMTMDRDVLDSLLVRIEDELGFDASRLKMTPQPEG